jgi:ABC-type lipoprotein export system ATPase subunit
LLLTAGVLLAPTRGTVHIEGRDVYGLSAEQRAAFRARNIGFVFQQFHLIPYLNVRDNIRSAALATGAPDAAQRADELIERFGLTHRASHRPGALSTGERQRTAMARAILNGPKLILADEPTGNLDGDNAKIVLDYLSEFAESGGAVLLVTHEPAAAARAARTIEMEHGRLVESTISPADV